MIPQMPQRSCQAGQRLSNVAKVATVEYEICPIDWQADGIELLKERARIAEAVDIGLIHAKTYAEVMGSHQVPHFLKVMRIVVKMKDRTEGEV